MNSPLGSLLVLLLWIVPATGADRDDILIADFEGESYGAWQTTGDAFGSGPARGTLPGQMQVSGYRGNGLVNSFQGGDRTTGKLTSPAIRGERRYMSFLIGGGGYEGKTCMNLVRGGQVVRTATGPNTEPGGSEELELTMWISRGPRRRDRDDRIVDAMERADGATSASITSS
jgi:hypothetical protein